MSQLRIEGVWNVRDVGGIAASSGRIRSGVLLRSGNLTGLTGAGAEVLRTRVRHIVDLRSDEEAARFPTPVADITISHLPLFHGSTESFFQADATLGQLYQYILDEGADKLVEAMRIIGSGEPALVHCMVGKDRTGVTVALALAASGAEREAIVTDYALTESQLPAEFTTGAVRYLRARHPSAVNLEALAAKSPAGVMRALLSRLDERYGSAAQYLRAHGLSAGELKDLRGALVEPEQR